MSTRSVDQELRLQFLGAPQVHLGAEALTFTRRSSLALLAYLAVTGEPHSRQTLMALLTGDAAPTRASAHLRNALADLNQHIGDYLQVTRHTVALNPNRPAWLDVHIFDKALADAQATHTPHLLQTCYTLYRGEFLAGVSLRDAPEFEQWLLFERERLRQQAVQALSRLLTHTLEQGDAVTAMDIAQHLLQLDPWHEMAHQHLMRLLAQNGQRGAALTHYKAYQQRLAAELHTSPDEDTQALYTRLLTEGRFPITCSPLYPFIGRVAELNVLISSWPTRPAG
ncbi:MAG: bacterial transcriptional activator domain-containing protein [Anaerolineae bacterium]|nr:bacterial transcriptional activator domain-containing protein [Anaerolineae bacterium]